MRVMIVNSHGSDLTGTTPRNQPFLFAGSPS